MRGRLGEKIGEGAFAEVHLWAPGQVVKLFRPDVPRRIPWWEADMTRAVCAAGAPAPEVFDVIRIEGRLGIVLRRLEGPTLMHCLRSGGMSASEGGAVLATLARSVHSTPTPSQVLPLRDYMAVSLQLRDAEVPEPIAEGVLALIDRLAPDDRLAHCDLHAGNVVMTPEGPRIIDWTGAKRGGPALDLACCHFLWTELEHESLGDPGLRRALDGATQAEYARQAGLSAAALRTAVAAHLPIVRTFFLLGAAARPATRERLLRRLEADLAA
jgi:aminoglycoside phosphotransferase (APT) family kinase protein